MQEDYLVVDMGYSSIKSIDKQKHITKLSAAFVVSSENDNSIALNDTTKKITVENKTLDNKVIRTTRICGDIPCLLTHTSTLNTRKADSVRFNFSSILTLKQNNKSLRVVCIHNDPSEYDLIKSTLLGHYNIFVNNQHIQCEVIEVRFFREALGTYFYLKDLNLLPLQKNVRILDGGLAVISDLTIDSSGNVLYSKLSSELSVSSIAKSLLSSTLINSYMQNHLPSLRSIAYALEHNISIGNIPDSEWRSTARFYILEHFNKLKTYLLAPSNIDSYFVSTYILTGGLACLFEREIPNLKQIFLIPPNAHDASLIGILSHPDVKKFIFN